MMRLVILFICVLGLASPAFAQAQTAQPSVDPEALAADKELNQVTHSTQNTEKVFDAFVQQYSVMIGKVNPNQQAAVQQILQQSFIPVMKQHIPDMLNTIAGVYAQNFTADDMRPMIEFYKSAPGQKFLNKMPDIMSQYMQQAQPMILQMVKEGLQDAVGKLRQNNLQVPKEMGL